MLALETAGLSKDYTVGFWRRDKRRALDNLNLHVEVGEVYGLLGPNGAGKTTTLKILLRLIFPSAGTARLFGKDIRDLSTHARLGYLPEQPFFYDHLTAAEFLNYVGELFDLSPAVRRRRIADLIERLGLCGSEDVPLRKFSKGMLQRVGLAQALINDPELILLDEPMSGLDPLGRREVRDLILSLKQQGKTILFSTHILSDAETLCDQVAILHRGRLQGSGKLSEKLQLGVSVTEIVAENPGAEALAELSKYGRAAVHTGDWVRLEIPAEADVNAVLAIAVRHGVKIHSLNPVKLSLEDFFLAQVSADNDAKTSQPEKDVLRGGDGA